MEEKIDLIKQIVKFHPYYGEDKGWSTYTGGMADTGYWYWEKLIEVDNPTLSVFLKFLQGEEEKAKKQSEERIAEYNRVQALPKEEREIYYEEKRAEQRADTVKFIRDMEYKLLFGK